MRKSAFFALLGLLLVSLPATARKIEGIDIPDTLASGDGDTALALNGAGIRKKLFIDIYIGALYLPSPTSDVTAILEGTGPASVLMHFLYSEVSRKKITDGWTDGLQANLAAEEMASIRPRLENFNRLFRTVHKGDVIRIDYRPGGGTEVRINDEWRGSVAGNDFFRALLRVWLGNRPVSKPLRQGMLGLD